MTDRPVQPDNTADQPPTDHETDWDQRYQGEGYRYGTEPNPWLAAHAHLLSTTGKALDLACGEGRDAVYLAERGYQVEAIDASTVALEKASWLAAARGVEVDWRQLDLEGDYRIEPDAYDLITCHNFLHRPLLATIPAALHPGGLAVYATFMEGQERYGRPDNPDHLLRRGELTTAFTGLEILDYHEGLADTPKGPAMRAAIVARRRPAG